MAPVAISPGPYANGRNSPSYSANGDGSSSPSLSVADSLRIPKLSALRGVKGSALLRPRFGRSASVAFEGQNSIQDFLKTLKDERFRHMPYDGSYFDRVLKWADNIGGIILLSHEVLSDFMLNSEDATRLICDSCTALIRLGNNNIKAILKAFSVFHQMALALSVFLRHTHLIRSAPDVRRELAHSFQEFARFTSDVREYITVACMGLTSKGPVDLDTLISEGTSSFYDHLSSVSISMWTSGKQCLDIDLQAIRNFLTPQDTVVRNIMANQMYTEAERAEFTCEWFAPRLRKFMKNTSGTNSLFLVTGAACTGKTILARWIQEKLQETVDDEPYDVISYTVDTSVKYTTSPLSLIKSLLLQILDRKVGRMGLLSRISKALIQGQEGATESEVEDSLWSALGDSLDGRKLLIIVDGLDQLLGRSGNPLTLEKLSRVTKGKKNIKSILLSRPLSDGARKHCQEYLALEEAKETGNDIRNRIEDFLEHCEELHNLRPVEKSEIIQKHVEMSKGSFLWGELHLAALKHGDSASDILKTYQKAPQSVDEYIDQLITKLDWKRSDTKRLLSWMLAAERPFTLRELKSLIEVDLDGCAYRPFTGDVEKFVRQLCGSLIVVRDNLVYLRHPSIREHLLAATTKEPKAINIKDAHRELATRAMAYVKIHLLQHNDLDPQADLHIAGEIDRDFRQLALFEYASRYWISHFRSSSLYDPATNKFTLSDNFRVCFSNTTKLALWEGTCLARQYIALQAEKLQTLSMALRKTLFGETSPAYLQSLLLELHVARGFKDAHFLSNVAYEAFSVSRNVCSSAIVQTLAEAFIEYSASLRVSEHGEFRAKKIEVLRYLIEAYEHQHVALKQIIYLGFLAELYVDINEVQQAVAIYRQLYRLRLQAHGHLHDETHSLFHLLVSYMKRLSLYDEVLEISLEYHQYLEEHLVITDQRRIDSTMVIVQIYEDRKDYFRAEQTLVRYWKSVSCAEATSRITELKIEFGLKYTEFLHRYSRKEECEVILRGLWTEIQTCSYEYRFQSTMIKRVQTIAEFFSKLEIFTMSRSIYQSLYEYYESREERTSTECITIVRSLAETVTRSFSFSKTVSSSSTTTTTTTTVISKEERKTLTEIFESSLETTKISSTTIAICQALCSSYTYEERYEEACEIYFRVISKVWASIETVSVSTDITEITEHLTIEILELCVAFAECHFKLLHIEIAEAVYLNIFRALICVRHIENNGFLLGKIKLIIAFFEMTYKFERVIEIYRELFIWMPICFGKTHHETITILMAFARICFRLGLYEEACTACFYVYSHFHISHGCLHIDGFAAAILLAEIYEIQCKWHLAYEVYGYLWRTFCHYGVEYKIEATVIQKVYERYIFILEHKELCEFNVLLQMSKEFHQHCVTLYKHHHEVTIRATLAYAEYCEQREELYELCISLYQQVIKYCKKSKTEFTKKTLHTCNCRVAKIYSSSSKEITKAVEIYHEEFEMCRKTSWTSTETLTALHSYVSTCKKQSTTESITKATETLKRSTLEIFKQNCSTETLISSARSIAKTYKECSFTEQAQSLVVEMRSTLVEEVRSSVATSKECHHTSYVFLASFQETISESSSFSSVMAEIREEILLYQSYFSATKVQADYRAVLKSGCGLYFHLQHKKECHSEFVKINQELTEYFCKYLDYKQKIKGSVVDLFFQLYIKEVTKAHYEEEVVKHAEISVLRYTKTAKFAEAYDLVLLVDRFIHLHGGFHSEFYVRVGFNLAKYLVGVGTNKCANQKLYASMFDLSIIILQEALQGLDMVDMELYELQQLLADLISILSEQKNYGVLERILQALWKSRKVRNNLSSSPLVLYIGRSLIQTLACLGKFNEAIHLCHHIRYNLAYIRGALDKSTLELTTLLSELYTQQKRFDDAIELHEDVLYRIGDGQSAPGLDALSTATTHADLLKMAYKRQGSDKVPSSYFELFSTLDRRFKDNQAWKEKRPQPEKWTPGVKDTETLGCWKKPGRFEWPFEEEETHVERGWREELVKRRVSGKYWGKNELGHGSAGRQDYFEGTDNGRIYNAAGTAYAKEKGIVGVD